MLGEAAHPGRDAPRRRGADQFRHVLAKRPHSWLRHHDRPLRTVASAPAARARRLAAMPSCPVEIQVSPQHTPAAPRRSRPPRDHPRGARDLGAERPGERVHEQHTSPRRCPPGGPRSGGPRSPAMTGEARQAAAGRIRRAASPGYERSRSTALTGPAARVASGDQRAASRAVVRAPAAAARRSSGERTPPCTSPCPRRSGSRTSTPCTTGTGPAPHAPRATPALLISAPRTISCNTRARPRVESFSSWVAR